MQAWHSRYVSLSTCCKAEFMLSWAQSNPGFKCKNVPCMLCFLLLFFQNICYFWLNCELLCRLGSFRSWIYIRTFVYFVVVSGADCNVLEWDTQFLGILVEINLKKHLCMHLMIQVCHLVPSARGKPVNVSSDCCKTKNKGTFYFILCVNFFLFYKEKYCATVLST